MKFIFFCFAFLSFYFPIGAQIYSQDSLLISTLEEPKTENYKNAARYRSSLYLQNSEKFLKSLDKKYSGKLRQYLKNSYEKLHIDFNDEILNENLIFNDSIDAFVNSIIQKIRKTNPEIEELQFYISKDDDANAFAMGDQTILINFGLFYFLKNEAELASVIAHEVGHQLLNHNVEMLVNSYKKENSRAYQKQLTKLRKNKFKKQEKALQLLKDRLYEERNYSRTIEFEADSIGYILYKNAHYPPNEYISAIQTLKVYDSLSPCHLKNTIYEKIFNIPTQKFQKKWMQKEDFSMYHYTQTAKLNADSIRSHPMIPQRIAKLKMLYPELSTTEISTDEKANPQAIFQWARKQRLPNLYQLEEYGKGVYYALLFLQDEPKNLFYRNWLGRHLKAIYEARKQYTTNRYLERIEPLEQDENYQQFLSFMWNLELEALKDFSEYYSK